MSELFWFIFCFWLVFTVLSLLFRKVTILHSAAGILGMFFGLTLLAEQNTIFKVTGLALLCIGLYWIMDLLIFHKISDTRD